MDVDRIITEYKINIGRTKPLGISGLQKSTRVFKVSEAAFMDNLYIIDTPSGKEIACHPHIVGKELDKLALSAAGEAAQTISSIILTNKKEDDTRIVVENVLRASQGYKLFPALKALLPSRPIPQLFIRPRYVSKSYRNHVTRELQVVYKDFSELPKDKNIVLIKPDTEATGASGVLSVTEALNESKKRGSNITDVVLYGFIAIPALKLLKKTTDEHGIKLHAFAIGNISELASNNYDMTLYGIDESYFSKHGEIKKLGSIVDKSTLENYLQEFIPGCDQPGDWSDRQSRIFTGLGYETGDIKGHLTRSINLIENLRKISKYEAWQDAIARKEITKLRKVLSTY